MRPLSDLARPLHVRVAEALGCVPKWHLYAGGHDGYWTCTCADSRHQSIGVDGAPHEGFMLESYDTDWSATGPLIELLPITLVWDPNPQEPWRALSSGCGAGGKTALIAVCNLILALATAGKLTSDTPSKGTVGRE